MSDFETAAQILIYDWEGGEYTNTEGDAGGPTKWGVTMRVLSDYRDGAHVTEADIRAMTPELSAKIWRALWWEPFGYGEIVSTQIATRILMAAVNMGPDPGHRVAQRACRCAGANPVVAVDGILGPLSKAGINSAAELIWLAGFRGECVGAYREMIAGNEKLEQFRLNWERRGYL